MGVLPTFIFIYQNNSDSAFSSIRTFSAVGLEPGRKAGIRPAQVASLSQCVQTALYYCVKRKLSVDPCWPSVYSAESGPISLGINAQRGTSIQRPRNSLSQPLPFTAPWPLSDTHRKTVSLPHQSLVRCPGLSSQTPASRCITVWAPVRWADPALAWDSDDDKRSIRRKKYRRRRRRRRRRRTTALDLKKQQLRQPHCHSICFMLSAAAGQFTAWEPQNNAILHPQLKGQVKYCEKWLADGEKNTSAAVSIIGSHY